MIGQPIVENAQIMRAQIPECIDVGSNRPQIGADGMHGNDLADGLLFEKSFHVSDAGIEFEDMTHHENPFPLLGQLVEFMTLLDRSGQGLLHEDVFVG